MDLCPYSVLTSNVSVLFAAEEVVPGAQREGLGGQHQRNVNVQTCSVTLTPRAPNSSFFFFKYKPYWDLLRHSPVQTSSQERNTHYSCEWRPVGLEDYGCEV